MSRRLENERLQWWLEARFGISFHWGIASVPGRGDGWLRSVERMPAEDYAVFFDHFAPEPGCFRHWARAAREAGAGWCLLTAKHHDGFCLFQTALTRYQALNTPARRDLVREFVEAVRAEGLAVGLYYSLVDWHHEDYPAAGDRQHPLRDHPDSPARDRRGDWSRYIAYLHGQVRELLTQYGRIDLLALDFSYGEFQGERWGATDLVRLIRSLQPGILLNDRLQPDAIKLHPRPAWAGDFDSTELVIPRRPVLSAAGERIPFDAWFPLGDTWFHSEGSQYFKPWPMLVRSLVNAVSKDGCLHLNLAPDARGRIDDRQRAELAGLGRWLAVNRESVRGAGPADLPKPEWGRWTARAGQLYAHILEPPVGHLCLPGLDGHVSAPVRLDQGPVRLTGYWNPGIQSFDQPGDVFLTFGDFAGGTHPLPDSPDTVVRMPWDGRSGGASSG